MSELLAQTPTEFATLSVVVDGEPIDNFASPNLLEGTPESEAAPSSEPFTYPTVVAMTRMVDVAPITPESLDKPSLRERFYHSRLGRLAISGLTALGLASGGVAIEATPAFADSNPVYTVTNHDHDGTNGIYYRNSPNMSDSIRRLPYYARYGDRIELICGTNGESVGQYNNRRWHLAKDLDNPTAPGQFYIPDHDTNTPNKANQPTPGEKECGSGNSPNLGNQTGNPQQAETVRPFVEFNRSAAISWALAHAKDAPPNAGSCTWFISQALAKGGFPQTDTWNTYYQGAERWGIRFGTDAAKIAPDFLAYMKRQSYVEVRWLGQLKTGINNISEGRPGDIILYDWENNGSADHAVMITGAAKNNPQYPLVSGWSEDGGRALSYNQRGWTWSEKEKRFLQKETDEHGKLMNENMSAWIIHIRTEDDM